MLRNAIFDEKKKKREIKWFLYNKVYDLVRKQSPKDLVNVSCL